MNNRVLVISLNPVGGIRTYFHYVYSAEVFDSWYKWLVVPIAEDKEIYNNCFKDIFESKIKNNLGFIVSILTSFIKIRPNVIHSHGITTGILVSFLQPFLPKCKHIVTLHDVLSDYHFKGWKGKLRRIAVQVLLKRAHSINPCGNDVVTNLVEYFPKVNLDKLNPIKNGIDTHMFKEVKKRDFNAELNLSNGQFVFGFFGRFMNQKGFDLIRKAVKTLHEQNVYDFSVVCFGDGGFIREEKALVLNDGTDSLFYFLPHTTNVGAAIKGVDCALMPSRWEACPLLPMEVMCCGIPLIASDCIGMRDVCTSETPAIISSTGDYLSLAEAMEKFMKNSNHFKENSSAYSEKALNEFSSSVTAEKLEHLYRKLTA